MAVDTERKAVWGNVTKSAAATVALVVMIAAAVSAAQAQQFSVIHTFTGGGDGGSSYAGLSIDRGGTCTAPPPRADNTPMAQCSG